MSIGRTTTIELRFARTGLFGESCINGAYGTKVVLEVGRPGGKPIVAPEGRRVSRFCEHESRAISRYKPVIPIL